jgi:hypothetical protein
MTANQSTDPQRPGAAKPTVFARIKRYLHIVERWLLAPFEYVIRKLDSWLRWLDYYANLTCGGALTRIKITRHTLAAVCLPAALVFFFVNGPSLRDSERLGDAFLAALVSAGVFAALLWAGERLKSTLFADLLLQCGLLTLIGGVIWTLAPEGAIERQPFVYQHVLLPASAAIGIATLVAAIRSRWLFGKKAWAESHVGIAGRLPHVELFVERLEQPRVTLSVLLVGMMNAVVSSPARVLFFPSLFALLVERDWVAWTFFSLLALNLVVMAFANIDARFNAAGDTFGRQLFSGWPAAVSLLIIVVGIARVSDFQYVSTLFDGARNYTIGGYLIALYVVLWWHDYWVENLMSVRFLGLLAGGADDCSRLAYPIDRCTPRRGVPADGRFIQAHGAGRLLVVYPKSPDGNIGPFFHGYTLAEMADALGDDLSLNDPTRRDLDWARWRMQGDRMLATVVLGIVLYGGYYLLKNPSQVAHIEAPGHVEERIPVSTALFGDGVCTSDGPILAVAASGGGTRAALYTAAALERLQLAHRLADVRLLSGVSGGGVALTYFAAHRADLIKRDNPEAWKKFFDAMRQPYIEDVLDGSGEWRLLRGVRLGRLLAESFERHWGAPDKRFGSVTDVGLMLNSSIAGRFVRTGTPDPSRSLADEEQQRPKDGLSDVAGGRVVYTNLELPDHFGNPALFRDQDKPRETRDARLPVFVVKGSHVRLSAAAAANANFPPVFSNVPIDLDHLRRMWVTDGGAIDNRGTETLLMAIRYALAQKQGGCEKPPAIHVLELEASAFSDGYQQDRGLGSMMAAGTAFASQLDAELITEIRKQYGGAVRFHYLPMPALLRRSGSFGTHWMMQKRVQVCKDKRCDDDIILQGDDVITILRGLQDKSLPETASAQARDAHAFIRCENGIIEACKEPSQQPRDTSVIGDLTRWTQLTACLKDNVCQ